MRPSRLQALFLLSGFCGLVYQVVWLRLAMAAFGVTAPLISTVLSVFMAGLAAGSWVAGRLATRGAAWPGALPLRIYAAAEVLIGFSGLMVPWLLTYGHELLAVRAVGVEWGSLAHHLAAGSWVAISLFPFCLAMGATLPLGMWAIRRTAPGEASGSFSRLYLANTVGACLGTMLSAFVLIELLGFRGTLSLAAAVNAMIAALALGASRAPGATAASGPARTREVVEGLPSGRALAVTAFLFCSGFSSLGMEVAWVRLFTPWVGTEVYAFAIVVGIYLAATFAGSWFYTRRNAASEGRQSWSFVPWLAGGAGLAALLPLAAADPRLPWAAGYSAGGFRVALAVMPFCGLLGYLTPALVERASGGDPGRAGSLYAVNTTGCILGPIAAGFGLLPGLGERWTIGLLGTVLLLLAPQLSGRIASRRGARVLLSAAAAAGLVGAVVTITADPFVPGRGGVVLRDATATVVASGEGMHRQLLVNGVGMTEITPITKLMAHLPLTLLSRPPESALAICFGMGTTFRSLASWGIRTTAVELVPSVPELFGYFHDDAPGLLQSPRVQVVIDDGRRLLERDPEAYDVITIDPPPPVSAAGSSLLYSLELYQVARSRLRPGGILQQWIPEGDAVDFAAFSGALAEAFPHTLALRSIEGWGVHLLGSDRPIALAPAEVLAARLPAAAAVDLLEWGPESTAEAQLRRALAHPLDVGRLRNAAPGTDPLSDDRPVNEYYLLRSLRVLQRDR